MQYSIHSLISTFITAPRTLRRIVAARCVACRVSRAARRLVVLRSRVAVESLTAISMRGRRPAPRRKVRVDDTGHVVNGDRSRARRRVHKQRHEGRPRTNNDRLIHNNEENYSEVVMREHYVQISFSTQVSLLIVVFS